MSGLERRVALRNSGLIDPGDIGGYIERARGYLALTRALKSGPEATLAALEESGLQEPGSLLPVAVRWKECREAPGDVKYVVCEAVDADPLSPTAKLLLGSDPHAVLEGLLIVAAAVGAEHCFVCINADYGDEREILETALVQMKERRLLGGDVLGSGSSLEVTVKEVPHSLVAGEETALLRALQGAQPLPYLRPQDALWSGLHGHPTLVESAETLAKVSAVLHPDRAGEGAATKMVTVSREAEQLRTLEVPLGTTVRAVLQEALNEAFDESSISAVQFGGPAGCLLAGDGLDTPIEPEALAEAGCVMGSGRIGVLAAGRCAVESTRDLSVILREGSCGKCVFCREGTRQIVDILDDVLAGKADEERMQLLVELCEAMRAGSICALGLEAPVPVLSALRLFAEDFDAHLAGGKCPEGAA